MEKKQTLKFCFFFILNLYQRKIEERKSIYYYKKITLILRLRKIYCKNAFLFVKYKYTRLIVSIEDIELKKTHISRRKNGRVN